MGLCSPVMPSSVPHQCPRYMAVDLMIQPQSQSSTKGVLVRSYLWITVCVNMVFVMANSWLAQRSNTKAPFRFRSGRPLFPINFPTSARPMKGSSCPTQDHEWRPGHQTLAEKFPCQVWNSELCHSSGPGPAPNNTGSQGRTNPSTMIR